MSCKEDIVIEMEEIIIVAQNSQEGSESSQEECLVSRQSEGLTPLMTSNCKIYLNPVDPRLGGD